MTGLRPAGEAMARVRDQLEGVRPADQPPFVNGTPWMPDLEEEADGYALRLRGAEALASYRYAIAIARNEVPRSLKARILVRIAGRAHAFDARWISAGGVDSAELVGVRCCRACGCTYDRACAGGCAWIAQDLCSACAERA